MHDPNNERIKENLRQILALDKQVGWFRGQLISFLFPEYYFILGELKTVASIVEEKK